MSRAYPRAIDWFTKHLFRGHTLTLGENGPRSGKLINWGNFSCSSGRLWFWGRERRGTEIAIEPGRLSMDGIVSVQGLAFIRVMHERECYDEASLVHLVASDDTDGFVPQYPGFFITPTSAAVEAEPPSSAKEPVVVVASTDELISAFIPATSHMSRFNLEGEVSEPPRTDESSQLLFIRGGHT